MVCAPSSTLRWICPRAMAVPLPVNEAVQSAAQSSPHKLLNALAGPGQGPGQNPGVYLVCPAQPELYFQLHAHSCGLQELGL